MAYLTLRDADNAKELFAGHPLVAGQPGHRPERGAEQGLEELAPGSPQPHRPKRWPPGSGARPTPLALQFAEKFGAETRFLTVFRDLGQTKD